MKKFVRRLIASTFIVALPSLSFAQTPGGGGVGVVLSGDATATSGGAVTYKGGVLATNPAIGMVSGTTDNSPLVSTLLLALTNPAPGALGGGGNAIFPAVQGMDKTPYYFSQAINWSRNGSVSCQGASSGPRQEGVALVVAAGEHGFINNAAVTAADSTPGLAQLSGCSLWSLGYGTTTTFTQGNPVITGQVNAGFGAIPATVWTQGDGFLAYGKFDSAWTTAANGASVNGNILTINLGTAGTPAALGGNTGTPTVTMDSTTPVLPGSINGVYQIVWSSPTAYTVYGPNASVLGTGVSGGTAFGTQLKFTTGGSPLAGDEVDVTVTLAGMGTGVITAGSSFTSPAVGLLAPYQDVFIQPYGTLNTTGRGGTGTYALTRAEPATVVPIAGAPVNGVPYAGTEVIVKDPVTPVLPGAINGLYKIIWSTTTNFTVTNQNGVVVCTSTTAVGCSTPLKFTVTGTAVANDEIDITLTSAAFNGRNLWYAPVTPNGAYIAAGGVSGSTLTLQAGFEPTRTDTIVPTAGTPVNVLYTGTEAIVKDPTYPVAPGAILGTYRILWSTTTNFTVINPLGATIGAGTNASGFNNQLRFTVTGTAAASDEIDITLTTVGGLYDWRLPADHAFTLTTTGTARLTGNATIVADVSAPVDATKASNGVYRVVWTSATAFNVFEPSGALVATGANGVTFNNQIKFVATAGATAMASGDEIDLTVATLSTLTSRAANGGTATIVLDPTTPVLTGATAGVYRVVFTGASAFTVTDPKGVVLAGTTAPFANQLKFTLGGGGANVGDEIDVAVTGTVNWTMTAGASGNPSLKLVSGDFIWSQAFNFGCVVYQSSGAAGSQTGQMISTFMTTTSTNCQALKIGSYSAWIIPAAQKAIGQIYVDNNYYYGFPIGFQMMSSSGSVPLGQNATHSIVWRNSAESAIISFIDAGNNTGASDYIANEGIHASLADFVMLGTVGSGYHDNNSNSAESSNAPVGVIQNCTNPNSSVIFGSYIGTPPPGAASCADPRGLGYPTIYGSGRLIIGNFGGSASDMTVLSYTGWTGSFRIGPSNGPSFAFSGKGMEDPVKTAKLFFSKDGTVVNGTSFDWNTTTDSWDFFSFNTPTSPVIRFTGKNYSQNGGAGYGGLDVSGNVSFPRGILLGSQASVGNVVGGERLFDSRAAAATIIGNGTTIAGIKQGNFTFNNAPVPGGNGCWIYTGPATTDTKLGCPISNSTTKMDLTVDTIRTGVAPGSTPTFVGNKDFTGRKVLAAGTASFTLLGTYASAGNCGCWDTTTPANVCSVAETNTTLTFTGTGTDTIKWHCDFTN